MKAFNLPNQITAARLLLAIGLFAVLSQYDQRQAESLRWLMDTCTVLFVVTAGTDFFDGYLARKYNLVTALGRVMDPLVDKILVCGTFILFAGAEFVDANGVNVSGVQSWMVIAIVGREMLVTGLRGYNESVGVRFGASIFGKLKMWTQSITAVVVMMMTGTVGVSLFPKSAMTIKSGFVWLTVVVTIASALQYIYESRHILSDTGSSKPAPSTKEGTAA